MTEERENPYKGQNPQDLGHLLCEELLRNWSPDKEKLRQMIEAGADVNFLEGAQHDFWAGQRPLEIAAMKHSAEYVDILIAAGARLEGQNKSGETALYKAVYLGSWPVVERLLQHGANPNIVTRFGDSILYRADAKKIRILAQYGIDLDLRDGYKMTPLQYHAHRKDESRDTLENWRTLKELVEARDARLEDERATREKDAAQEKDIQAHLQAGLPLQSEIEIPRVSLKPRRPGMK